MNAERGPVFLTTLIVLAATVAAGPLVPGIDLTREGEFPDSLYRGFGRGASGVGVEQRLAFQVESLPDGGTLTEQAGEYRVRTPPASLRVEAVGGRVVAGYVLRIPALGYERRTTATVPAGGAEIVELDAPAGTVPAGAVNASAYEATVLVTVTQGDRSFTVARRTITLEVPE